MIWFVVMSAVMEAVNWLQPTDEAFMDMVLSGPHWLLVVATVVMAPLMEEGIFRGYLFKALRGTPLGAAGTVLMTSLLFSALHMQQYSIAGLVQIFSLALILGMAREQTGSLVAPLVIHVTQNALANLVPLLGQ